MIFDFPTAVPTEAFQKMLISLFANHEGSFDKFRHSTRKVHYLICQSKFAFKRCFNVIDSQLAGTSKLFERNKGIIKLIPQR